MGRSHTVVDLKQIRAEGFDHIRLPVGWHHYTGPAPDFKLSDEIFDKADHMVTNATALGLNVIINLHHFNEFTTNPAANTPWFHAIWRQVAAHYARRAGRRRLRTAQRTQGRRHNRRHESHLRRSHPPDSPDQSASNHFVGPGQWNSPDELPKLRLPDDDDNLIVTLHCYDPMFFTHQGAAGPDRTQGDRRPFSRSAKNSPPT